METIVNDNRYQITCPHCGQTIPLSEEAHDAVLHQVKTEAFNAELEDRCRHIRREMLLEHQQKEEAAVKKAKNESQGIIDGLMKELSDMREKLAAEKASVRAELTESFSREKDILRQQMQEKLNAEKEESMKNLQKQVETAAKDQNALLQKMHDELRKQEKAFDEKERALQTELDYYKDLKARASTKMVGESLEQHCEMMFEAVRMMGFPNAYFQKDNDAVQGSKGDYIFRDYADDGEEYISIMFEMKNEMQDTKTKHKNSDFFKKLDKDRREKNCTYAVLVSLLEDKNDNYNRGIVKVFQYEDMYVIRPQFFIEMIALLRDNARKSYAYQKQIAMMRSGQQDKEELRQKAELYQADLTKALGSIQDNSADSLKQIDAVIVKLQKVRAMIAASESKAASASASAERMMELFNS